MKKRFVYLLSLLGLCLCACNSGNNNNVVDSPKYTSRVEYFVEKAHFDNYQRFCADLYEYNLEQVIYVKSICVYLSGYYYTNNSQRVIEYKKTNSGYDYYYYGNIC